MVSEKHLQRIITIFIKVLGICDTYTYTHTRTHTQKQIKSMVYLISYYIKENVTLIYVKYTTSVIQHTTLV